MDTLTAKDPPPPSIGDPQNHKIPVRFHMYWAGSDADGSVVGYFYAVTETTTVPDALTGRVPSLPGPKPRDYHYTTKTDTTFIFNVSETSPDRQHAFYLYAVDNQGKPDPTPATFFFTANDKFPPTPIILVARAFGKTYSWEGGSYSNGKLVGGRLVAHDDIRDFTDQSIRNTIARDTGAVNARLQFKWRAQLGIPGSFVEKYCYRLEEPSFVCVPPQVDTVSYASGFTSGLKLFTLRTVDQAGGARDSTRRFNLDYMPDTWFSGPDSTLFPNPDRNASGDRWYISLAQVQNTLGGLAGTLMSPDSVSVLPLFRQPRKTFFEIYNGNLFYRSENDTIHMGSWTVFYSGGYDKDSKYRVRVDPTDTELPSYPGPLDPIKHAVFIAGPENGSPIGFRSQVVLDTDPSGGQTNFAQTSLYPIFEPSSVFRFEGRKIGGYWPLKYSGKAYALVRAEDGDGLVDTKVEDVRSLAELVDRGGGTQAQIELRNREIMTFYVNKSPYLVTSDPSFKPKPGGTTVFTGSTWSLYLPANDVDPFDPATGKVGAPTGSVILRYKLTVIGKSFFTGKDFTWVYDPGGRLSPYYRDRFTPPGPFVVPPELAGGLVKLRVELCDCERCEQASGTGRCITTDFDVTYVRTY